MVYNFQMHCTANNFIIAFSCDQQKAIIWMNPFWMGIRIIKWRWRHRINTGYRIFIWKTKKAGNDYFIKWGKKSNLKSNMHIYESINSLMPTFHDDLFHQSTQYSTVHSYCLCLIIPQPARHPQPNCQHQFTIQFHSTFTLKINTTQHNTIRYDTIR